MDNTELLFTLNYNDTSISDTTRVIYSGTTCTKFFEYSIVRVTIKIYNFIEIIE